MIEVPVFPLISQVFPFLSYLPPENHKKKKNDRSFLIL